MLSPDLGTRLQEIHHLLTNGAGDDALGRMQAILTELNNDGDAPSRLIAAHLRAAEVLIERTHLAPAAESLEKAIYVVTHESQIGDPDPQLNV